MDPTKYNAGGGRIDPYGTAKSTSNRFIKVGNEYVRESTLKGATSNAPDSPLPAVIPSGSGNIQAPGTAPMTPNETPSSTSPADAFNQMMMLTLRQAQGVGTADILKRKRELERMQSAEIMGGRPEDQDLAGLSPEAQNAIRNSRTKTFQPLIDEQAYQIEKAQQNLDNFFKINEQAMKFGQEFADKIVAPDSVIENAKLIIETNPEAFGTVLSQFNDKTKQKIIGSLDYSKIKKKETPIEVTAGSSLYNPNTGELLATAPKDGATAGQADVQKQQTAKEILDLATTLKTLKGKSGAVGASFSKLFGALPLTPDEAIAGTPRANYEAQVKRLQDILALPNLEKLKGAMSDKDIMFLKSIGTALTTSMSEKAFDVELDKIIEKMSPVANMGGETKTITDPATGQPVQYKRVGNGWQKVSFSNGASGTTNSSIVLGSPLARANNNPGNIRYGQFAQSLGAVPGKNGFALFPDPQTGVQAVSALLDTGSYRNLTLAQMANRYAPPSENNTSQYIQQLSARLGVHPDTPIKNIDRNKLVAEIIRKESSSSIG